jgi:hypothetical protein
MAAYIDLNPVRAGIVEDPKDYRFCGYGEAVAGRNKARDGLIEAVGEDYARSWKCAHDDCYRPMIMGSGATSRAGKARVPDKLFEETVRMKGKLPLTTVLRCRIRYFTNGAVLGGRAFVAKQLASYRRRAGLRQGGQLQALPPVCDWGGTAADDIIAMRTPRRRAHS